MSAQALPCCDDLPELLELDAALLRMDTIKRPQGKLELCSLESARGRITGAKVLAPVSLPAFDSSAVDGYAFCWSDISGSSDSEASRTITVVGESLAGKPYEGPIVAGTAIRMATGAVLPAGLDTIIMQENCKLEGEAVVFQTVPAQGAYVRRRGADIEEGQVVVSSGHRLQPQDIALINGLGITTVSCLPKLRVSIASTGTELRAEGATLAAGQIVDTNSLMLKQLLEPLALDVTVHNHLPDQKASTLDALRTLSENHDLVITTGGVSVGSHDFVRDALHELGDVHFWRLAIRPGRPVLLGQIGNCLMAGLPGNPVSAMVTFFLVVRPLLNVLWGGKAALSPGFPLPLLENVKKESHLRSFPRARLEWVRDAWHAVLYKDQSSNLISSLVKTDGLLDLPIGKADLKAGDIVTFRPMVGLLD